MPDEKHATLGEGEIEVMRLIWKHQPCTERQISDLVRQERDVTRSTVLTVIQRLEAKRFLTRVPGHRPIRFRATVDENRMLSQLLHRFVERILGGSTEPLVAYLAESRNLSPHDLKLLQRVARKVDRTVTSAGRPD
jgi:predicted transcriptional regulator